MKDSPICVYDGDCKFCTNSVSRWKQTTGDAVIYAPYQKVASQFPTIPQEEFARSIKFIEKEGKVLSGAHAVLRILSYSPGNTWLLWLHDHVLPFRLIADAVYYLISQHRHALPKI